MRRNAYLVLVILGACGGGGSQNPDAAPDLTAHCEYEALPPTAGAGGTVQSGDIMAGAAEARMLLPVGSAMGGFTGRAGFLGNAGKVDIRRVEMSGAFNPSVGYETHPMVKALALSAGGEEVVLFKVDLIFADDTLTHEVAEALGPAYHGKVLVGASHSHSAPGHWSANTGLAVGNGRLRYDESRERLKRVMVETAQKAIAARRPARLGVAIDTNFDPEDRVTRDRRGENDALMGGKRKDDFLAVLRVEGTDGVPIALVSVFGIHGTTLDADNPMFTIDSPGYIERVVEETFDTPVVVMHLQGAGGDVSPAGSGGIEKPAGAKYHANFAKAESVGVHARDMIRAAWDQAGTSLMDQVAMEMVTRSIETGPHPETFTIRDGALAYAPFEPDRPADRIVHDEQGNLVSPIDEFNAPRGAALCGSDMGPVFPAGEMPNTLGVEAYQSCVRIEVAGEILGEILDLPFEGFPVCASTRTTVTAFRLGEFLFITLPGEPVTLLADRLRELSPVDADKTIVIGYAQGHVGYLLTAEDWVLAGYEPSINFWGPLEAEYIAEQAAKLAALAITPEREDAAAGGATRIRLPQLPDEIPPPDPAPQKGTIPATLPADLVYIRGPFYPSTPQPDATVPRVSGIARFVWIGEDPLTATPIVTLQRETSPGTFTDVTRRSGRRVQDADLLVTWTPDPLRREGSDPRTHYWAVEWQAVAWTGDVEDRGGAPLGNYRFHVRGDGYELTSDPFQVVPAALQVTAAQAGGDVTATIRYAAPEGVRLLDLQSPSNQPLPVRRGPVTATVTYQGGGTDTFTDIPVTLDGQLTVTPTGGTPASITITDRFGNSGTAPL